MYCPDCGAELPDGSRFCGYCGYRMDQPDASRPAENGTSINEAGNGDAASDPDNNTSARSGMDRKPARRIILIAAAVLIIAAAIVAIVLLTRNSSDEPAADSETATAVSDSSTLTWQKQYDLGVRYLEELDYEAAIVAFTEAIAIDPKQTEAYLGRAEAYLGAGDTEDYLSAALADYQTVLELDADQIDVYIAIGNIYIATEDYEPAIEAYTAAIDGGTQNPAAWTGRGDARMAMGSTAESRAAARSDYQEAVDLDPALTDIFLKIAEICLADEDYKGAVEALTGAIDGGTEDPAAWCRRAEARLALGDTEEIREAAAEDYQAALDRDGSLIDIWRALADLYMQMEAYDRAIEAYTGAMEAGTEDPYVWLYRAAAYLAADPEGNQANALADYNAALAMDDTITEGWISLAALYMEMGEYELAADAYTRAIETGGETAELYLLRGAAYMALAEADPDNLELWLEESLNDYLSASELDPESAEAWAGIAEVYIQQGSAAEAVTLLTEVLETGLWDAELYMARGDAYMALEQTEENLEAALLNYRNVTLYTPQDADAYVKAADVCILLGDSDGAAEYLAQASENTGNEAAADALEDLQTAEAEAEAILIQTFRELYLDDLLETAVWLEQQVTAHTLWGNYYLDLYGSELRAFLASLESELIIPLDNGLYLGLYPAYWNDAYEAFIYYGQMEDGVRSGTGLWFASESYTKPLAGTFYSSSAYLGSWSNDRANGSGTYTNANGETYCVINYQNGSPYGDGTFYDIENGGSCSITVDSSGSLEKIYTYEGEQVAILYTTTSGAVKYKNSDVSTGNVFGANMLLTGNY